MALLSDRDHKELRKRLRDLAEDVTVVVFTQQQGPLGPPAAECGLCRETRELAGELAAASGRIHLEVHDFPAGADVPGEPAAARYGIERIPALALLGPGRRDMGIRFYGIPAGYELAAIVTILIRLSARTPELSPPTRQALAALDADVLVKVFVTPTCPYCPRAVYLAHQMAMASPRLRAEAIEAMEFPELAERYGVMGVPKIVINEKVEVEGAVPERTLLNMVLQAASTPAGQPAR